MRLLSLIVLFSIAAAAAACGGSQPSTPKQTFETYIRAMKAKDYSSMKILLSAATIKMHEQEAKAQGTNVDEIIKRQALLAPDQKTVEYRNEKVEGDKATLQYKNTYGAWETMPFVKEDGVWKIDKQGYADQLLNDINEDNRRIEEMINGNRQPTPY